jgi:four helix bundle protein
VEYEAWEQQVPLQLRQDPLWQLHVYRGALYIAAASMVDVTPLESRPVLAGILAQLVDAAGSIPANITEGYSRSSAKERAHFYEYALGSAREARTWYYELREALGPIALARIDFLTQQCRMLLALIARQRRSRNLRPDP